jgi:hypothetical protein
MCSDLHDSLFIRVLWNQGLNTSLILNFYTGRKFEQYINFLCHCDQIAQRKIRGKKYLFWLMISEVYIGHGVDGMAEQNNWLGSRKKGEELGTRYNPQRLTSSSEADLLNSLQPPKIVPQLWTKSPWVTFYIQTITEIMHLKETEFLFIWLAHKLCIFGGIMCCFNTCIHYIKFKLGCTYLLPQTCRISLQGPLDSHWPWWYEVESTWTCAGVRGPSSSPSLNTDEIPGHYRERSPRKIWSQEEVYIQRC